MFIDKTNKVDARLDAGNLEKQGKTKASSPFIQGKSSRHHLMSSSMDFDSDDEDLCPEITSAENPSVEHRHFRWRTFRSTLLLVVAFIAISFRNQIADEDPLQRIIVPTQTQLHEMVMQHMPYMADAWSRLNQTINSSTLANSGTNALGERQKRPGYQLAQEGAKAHYPIVMIPGFVTSSLELWEGRPCAQKYFRKRMWGGVGPSRSFFTDRKCWRTHLALDRETGKDPAGIRLRAAQSFDAADYFMSGYWVWNKLIENFAEVGYDATSMTMETYDWRLGFPLLEERDGYFTKLKATIEAIHKTSGRKIALISHSMGSTLVQYFFKWVTTPERRGGGGGGRDWVDRHVYTFVNIAGPTLGVAKAVPSLLSGEFKDTAVFSTMIGGSVVEQYWGRAYRKRLWETWGSLWTMLPTGGSRIWGQEPFLELTEVSEAVSEDHRLTQACMASTTQECHLSKKMSALAMDFSRTKEHSVEDTIDFLVEMGKSNGLAYPEVLALDPKSRLSPGNWHDPTKTPLPFAPKMKLFCFYGHGLDTERRFYYKRNVVVEQGEVKENDSITRESQPAAEEIPFIMDPNIVDAERNVQYGAQMGDGDASVPLVSLGYMCAGGWRTPELNPSGMEVITREYKHQEDFSVDDPIRGGPLSSEHVDILGNIDMTMDLLRIVTDFGTTKVHDRFSSHIREIVKEVARNSEGEKRSRGPLKFLQR